MYSCYFCNLVKLDLTCKFMGKEAVSILALVLLFTGSPDGVTLDSSLIYSEYKISTLYDKLQTGMVKSSEEDALTNYALFITYKHI